MSTSTYVNLTRPLVVGPAAQLIFYFLLSASKKKTTGQIFWQLIDLAANVYNIEDVKTGKGDLLTKKAKWEKDKL